MVRDVMLQAVENRFAGALKADSEIEWLSDNGSCYIADETLTVLAGNRPEARHDTRQKSAEQWDGRELRQNDEA
jgi:transposase InsO family protein